MELSERERVLSRIIAGYIRCKLRGETFLICPPTSDQAYIAQELYNDTYYEALAAGVLTADEAAEILKQNKIWTDEKQKVLDDLNKNVEELKIKIFEFSFKTKERKKARELLRLTEEKIEKLNKEKHSWDFATAEGLANQARFHFRLLCNLKDSKKNLIYLDDSFWNQPVHILDGLIACYHEQMIKESVYREIARTDPWRMTWNLAKSADKIFGIPLIDFSDEQRILCSWTKLYDDVREHQDCPNQAAIEDDDMLDGWLIMQNRRRAAEENKREVEGKISSNPKIQNADEIFVVASSQEDAQKIYDANPIGARVLVRQRMEKLQREKVVNEIDMPDTQQRLRQAVEMARKG